MSMKLKGPKTLYIDVETKPLEVYCWGLFDQNIGLDMVKEDWRILSVAAKWAHEDKVMQYDIRNGINDKNEKAMLKKVWNLLDEAELVVGQNSQAFDIKKLNERFLKFKMKPPSPFLQEDTLKMSKKNFAPTSHKLEYRSKQLNTTHKKSAHSKYPGSKLWTACIAGDQAAWKEMAQYNIFDVLSTEEYHNILRPWGTTVNINLFHEELNNKCSCGNEKLQKKGFITTKTGRFQRYICTNCGFNACGKTNLLSKDKRQSLLK